MRVVFSGYLLVNEVFQIVFDGFLHQPGKGIEPLKEEKDFGKEDVRRITAVGVDLLVPEDHGKVMMMCTFLRNHDSPEESEGMNIFGSNEIVNSLGNHWPAVPGNLPYPEVSLYEAPQTQDHPGFVKHQENEAQGNLLLGRFRCGKHGLCGSPQQNKPGCSWPGDCNGDQRNEGAEQEGTQQVNPVKPELLEFAEEQ